MPPLDLSVASPTPTDQSQPAWVREAGFWAAHLTFWVVVLGLWLLVRKVYSPQDVDVWPMVVARVVACLVATAGMRWLSKRSQLLERLSISRTGLVASGLLSAAVAITLAFGAIDGGLQSGKTLRPRLVADLAVNVSLLGNWCALYFGFQLIRERTSTEFRAIEAESLALRNELHRLQAQTSPHFLFNALNTVLASRDDPDTIETVTHSLAAYLRFLLRPAATLEPLSRELDALEQYLTVQNVRFGEGLATTIDCSLDVRDVLVPPVMVQPLVENAIKYGRAVDDGPLSIHVVARRDEDWLVIDVSNTGDWVAERGHDSTGTGLDSLARRLRLLVGPSASVHHAEADGWVRVVVRIPLGNESRGGASA